MELYFVKYLFEDITYNVTNLINSVQKRPTLLYLLRIERLFVCFQFDRYMCPTTEPLAKDYLLKLRFRSSYARGDVWEKGQNYM